jgi:hypothetical protein
VAQPQQGQYLREHPITAPAEIEANDQQQWRVANLTMTVDTCFTKPFDLDAFLECIARYCPLCSEARRSKTAGTAT